MPFPLFAHTCAEGSGHVAEVAKCEEGQSQRDGAGQKLEAPKKGPLTNTKTKLDFLKRIA